MHETIGGRENQKELAMQYLRLNQEAAEIRRQITSNLEQLGKVQAEGNEAQFGESYKREHQELSAELNEIEERMESLRGNIDDSTADEYLKLKTITKIDADGNESQHQIDALDGRY